MHQVGPFHGLGNVLADIFLSHVLRKFRPAHQLRRLFRRAAKKQCPPGGVHLVGEILQRQDARRIDGGHVTQAQDYNWRKLGKLPRHFIY